MHMPLQVLAKRARKNVAVDKLTCSVCVFAFDLLYLNGESLLAETLAQRRKKLVAAFQESPGAFQFVTHINTEEAGTIEDFLETAVLDNCEVCACASACARVAACAYLSACRDVIVHYIHTHACIHTRAYAHQGLMIKSLDTPGSCYVPDKRSREWLKVKKVPPRMHTHMYTHAHMCTHA